MARRRPPLSLAGTQDDRPTGSQPAQRFTPASAIGIIG